MQELRTTRMRALQVLTVLIVFASAGCSATPDVPTTAGPNGSEVIWADGSEGMALDAQTNVTWENDSEESLLISYSSTYLNVCSSDDVLVTPTFEDDPDSLRVLFEKAKEPSDGCLLQGKMFTQVVVPADVDHDQLRVQLEFSDADLTLAYEQIGRPVQ